MSNVQNWIIRMRLGTTKGFTLLSVGISLMATQRLLYAAETQDLAPSLGESGPPQAVQFNGATMWLRSGVAPQSPSAVLDAFQASCQPYFSTKVIGKDDVGYLACLRHGEGSGELSFWAQLRSLASGDTLTRLGRVLYVVARRVTGSDATHVLVVWTDGQFNLRELLPTAHDVPGGDSELVPRPMAARRILSARMVDRPYAVHVYESRSSVVEILKFYEETLGARGFAHIDVPGNPLSRGFKLGDAAVIVTTGVTALGFVRVSLVELGDPKRTTVNEWEAP